MTHQKFLFRMKPVAALLVCAGLLAGTSAARADPLSDLESAVKALQAQVEELKAQRAADAQKAAAAPATSQMPTQAMNASLTSSQVGTPGTASTMPISAQNTMSCTTRGLVSA